MAGVRQQLLLPRLLALLLPRLLALLLPQPLLLRDQGGAQ
jgi:hypothetical protein